MLSQLYVYADVACYGQNMLYQLSLAIFLLLQVILLQGYSVIDMHATITCNITVTVTQ